MASEWPIKSREMHNHHVDSTIWNDFVFRYDDIIIDTYAKSGTTWVQQIVAQLLFPGEETELSAISPWLDLRVLAKETTLAAIDAQTHRRFSKSHLPVGALVYSPRASQSAGPLIMPGGHATGHRVTALRREIAPRWPAPGWP